MRDKNEHKMRWYDVKFRTLDKYNPTERTVRVKATESCHASRMVFKEFKGKIEILSAKPTKEQ